jgi:hypothetical protein
MLQTYEFHVYGATEADGVTLDPVRVDRLPCFDEASAVSVARKMAKAKDQHGPIDVARQGPTPWNDRYIGTAMREYPYTNLRRTLFGRLD